MRHDPIAEVMRDHGFVLHRVERHRVWRHPVGAQVVTSVTTSDAARAARNARAVARRVLRQHGVEVRVHG